MSRGAPTTAEGPTTSNGFPIPTDRIEEMNHGYEVFITVRLTRYELRLARDHNSPFGFVLVRRDDGAYDLVRRDWHEESA